MAIHLSPSACCDASINVRYKTLNNEPPLVPNMLGVIKLLGTKKRTLCVKKDLINQSIAQGYSIEYQNNWKYSPCMLIALSE